MSSWKKFMGWAKILTVAFALSLLMFCFPTTAMAFSCTPGEPVVNPGSPFKEITIPHGGSFDVNTGIVCLAGSRAIRAVTVSLQPTNVTGKIDEIIITGPNGREFGCNPGTVSNGLNLINTCGGPAILEAGDTVYSAKGSFSGSSPVKLKVEFSSDFK
jgi:hypothetical protein